MKSIGAKIISITEGEVSPIASEADVMLKVTPPETIYVGGDDYHFFYFRNIGKWFDDLRRRKCIKKIRGF
ncbi:hypothetical protein [Bacillus sonorensis]|uniref:hypothetical protein n=1 Tax=Bacillus sonorensis TaxID=119858 RepID=UPI001ABFF746|nr:hypothetical protein [Bacillus sonorensis]